MPTAALGSALPSRARGILAKFAWRSPPKYAMREDASCARSEKQRYRPTPLWAITIISAACPTPSSKSYTESLRILPV